MELDPKINSVHDILTPFDTKEAANFIGEYCAFADDIEDFKYIGDFGNVHYGELKQVKETQDKPFEYELTVSHLVTGAKFCLPYGRLKSEYRPFEALGEFLQKFPLGSVIRYRDDDYVKTQLFTEYWTDEEGDAFIKLNGDLWSLEELFENFSLIEEGGSHPFGVEK